MSNDAPGLDFKNAALLIAAHGSPGSRGGRTSTRRHAETLAGRGLFQSVAAGFLTEKPFAPDVLKDLDAPEVYVVPNLAAHGFIATQKLPQALGLTGRVTERIGPKGRQRIHLTEPVGTHPLVAKIMADRIQGTLDGQGLDPLSTQVVVVGHGSTRGRESNERTHQVAAELPTYGVESPVAVALLEEPPFVKDWRALTDLGTVLFAPFLISDGFHASQDIPLAIGFDPGDEAFQDTLAAGGVNETQQDGTRILYIPALGDAPDMADLILARVLQARDLLDD